MSGSVFLDFRRVFSRRWAVGPANRFAEYVGQPIFVAIVVCMAFLAKERESTLTAFSNAFFYFTGLYAFWVGLFGSCQSINSEVQNGEWSYWTLGLRRSISHHVTAVFSVNLVCAIWIVLLFLAVVVSVSGYLSVHRGFNPFVSVFLTTNSAAADSLWQCGYILKPLLIAKFGVFGPLVFATAIYALSLFAAVVCGVCFGMLFSAVFRDPSVSLNASVAFVVLLGMLSLLGLQGDKSRSGSREVKSLDRGFAPLFESRRDRNGETESKATAVDVLVSFSRILPQRYFFNIARLPAEKDISDKARETIESELERIAGTNGNDDSVWWRKNVPIMTNLGWASWDLMPPGDPNNMDDLAAEILSHNGFDDRHGIPYYWSLIRRAIMAELLPLVFMCIACLFSVNVCVLTIPTYRQLR